VTASSEPYFTDENITRFFPGEKMKGATKSVPRLSDIMWARVCSAFFSTRSNTIHTKATIGFLYREIIGKGCDVAKRAFGIATKSLLDLRLATAGPNQFFVLPLPEGMEFDPLRVAEAMISKSRIIHLVQRRKIFRGAVLTAVPQ